MNILVHIKLIKQTVNFIGFIFTINNQLVNVNFDVVVIGGI